MIADNLERHTEVVDEGVTDVPKPDPVDEHIRADQAAQQTDLARERAVVAAHMPQLTPPPELQSGSPLTSEIQPPAYNSARSEDAKAKAPVYVKIESPDDEPEDRADPPSTPADAGHGSQPPEQPPTGGDKSGESGDQEPEPESLLERDKRLVAAWREDPEGGAELIKAYDGRIKDLARTVIKDMPEGCTVTEEDLAQEGRALLLSRASAWNGKRPLFRTSRDSIVTGMRAAAVEQGYPIKIGDTAVKQLEQLDDLEDWHERVPNRQPPTDHDVAAEFGLPLRAPYTIDDVKTVRRLAHLTADIRSLDEELPEEIDLTTLDNRATQTLEDTNRLTSPTSSDPEGEVELYEPPDETLVQKVNQQVDAYAHSARITNAREHGAIALRAHSGDEEKTYAQIAQELSAHSSDVADPNILAQQARAAATWVRDRIQNGEDADSTPDTAETPEAPPAQEPFAVDLDLAHRYREGDPGAIAKLNDIRVKLSKTLQEEYRGKLPPYMDLSQAIDGGTAGFLAATQDWAKSPTTSLGNYQLERAHAQIAAMVQKEAALFEDENDTFDPTVTTPADAEHIAAFTTRLGQRMAINAQHPGPEVPTQDPSFQRHIKSHMRDYINSPADHRRRLQRAAEMRHLSAWVGLTGTPQSVDELAKQEGISTASMRKKVYDAARGLHHYLMRVT